MASVESKTEKRTRVLEGLSDSSDSEINWMDVYVEPATPPTNAAQKSQLDFDAYLVGLNPREM